MDKGNHVDRPAEVKGAGPTGREPGGKLVAAAPSRTARREAALRLEAGWVGYLTEEGSGWKVDVRDSETPSTPSLYVNCNCAARC